MADSIHDALSAFRDTMLMSIAKLEFQLRDTLSRTRFQNPIQINHTSPLDRNLDAMSELSEIHMDNSLNEKLMQNIQDIANRMCSLESQIQTIRSSQSQPNCSVPSSQKAFAEHIERELMSIEPQQNTRNILVSSVRSTPALAAAVAAANPPPFDLTEDSDDDEMIVVDDSDEEVEVVEEEESEVEVVADAEEESEVEVVDDAVVVEEESQEEESEEAVEVEEFLYKGQTYQRDSENNVYLDGTQVGTWNGKKVVPL